MAEPGRQPLHHPVLSPRPRKAACSGYSASNVGIGQAFGSEDSKRVQHTQVLFTRYKDLCFRCGGPTVSWTSQRAFVSSWHFGEAPSVWQLEAGVDKEAKDAAETNPEGAWL